MFRLLVLLLLALSSVVHALSSTGNRLLVVTDDPAIDKEKYSTFWRDLESMCTPSPANWILVAHIQIGRGYRLSFESPKNDKLALFQHGERTVDHIMLLPTRSKGMLRLLVAQTRPDLKLKVSGLR